MRAPGLDTWAARRWFSVRGMKRKLIHHLGTSRYSISMQAQVAWSFRRRLSELCRFTPVPVRSSSSSCSIQTSKTYLAFQDAVAWAAEQPALRVITRTTDCCRTGCTCPPPETAEGRLSGPGAAALLLQAAASAGSLELAVRIAASHAAASGDPCALSKRLAAAAVISGAQQWLMQGTRQPVCAGSPLVPQVRVEAKLLSLGMPCSLQPQCDADGQLAPPFWRAPAMSSTFERLLHPLSTAQSAEVGQLPQLPPPELLSNLGLPSVHQAATNLIYAGVPASPGPLSGHGTVVGAVLRVAAAVGGSAAPLVGALPLDGCLRAASSDAVTAPLALQAWLWEVRAAAGPGDGHTDFRRLSQVSTLAALSACVTLHDLPAAKEVYAVATRAAAQAHSLDREHTAAPETAALAGRVPHDWGGWAEAAEGGSFIRTAMHPSGYETAMRAAVKFGDVPFARDILRTVRQQGIRMSAAVYGQVLRLAGQASGSSGSTSPPRSARLLETLKQRCMSPSDTMMLHTTLAAAHSAQGSPDAAVSTLQAAHDSGLELDAHAYTVLLQVHAKAGDISMVYNTLATMRKDGVPLDPAAVTVAAKAAVRAGHSAAALQLIDTFTGDGGRVDNHMYEVFMHAAGGVRDAEAARQFHLLFAGSPAGPSALFMEEPPVQGAPYTSPGDLPRLLVPQPPTGQLASKLGVVLSDRLYSHLATAFVRCADSPSALASLADAVARGIAPGHLTIGALLLGACGRRQNRHSEAVSVASVVLRALGQAGAVARPDLALDSITASQTPAREWTRRLRGQTGRSTPPAVLAALLGQPVQLQAQSVRGEFASLVWAEQHHWQVEIKRQEPAQGVGSRKEFSLSSLLQRWSPVASA